MMTIEEYQGQIKTVAKTVHQVRTGPSDSQNLSEIEP